jgi:hypothetical protein
MTVIPFPHKMRAKSSLLPEVQKQAAMVTMAQAKWLAQEAMVTMAQAKWQAQEAMNALEVTSNHIDHLMKEHGVTFTPDEWLLLAPDEWLFLAEAVKILAALDAALNESPRNR